MPQGAAQVSDSEGKTVKEIAEAIEQEVSVMEGLTEELKGQQVK